MGVGSKAQPRYEYQTPEYHFWISYSQMERSIHEQNPPFVSRMSEKNINYIIVKHSVVISYHGIVSFFMVKNLNCDFVIKM